MASCMVAQGMRDCKGGSEKFLKIEMIGNERIMDGYEGNDKKNCADGELRPLNRAAKGRQINAERKTDGGTRKTARMTERLCNTKG